MANQDGRYAYRPWNRRLTEGDQVPMNQFDSAGDMLMTQALSSLTIPAEELQSIVRPPLPQVQLFRPRFGYRERALGITDIIDINEVYSEPPTRANGVQPGAQGTERNAQGTGSW